MKNTILSMILFAAISATAQDIDWATRVRCELQTAGGTSLQDLTFSQGSTPLLAMDQYRLGRELAASTNVVATFIMGPTALSTYYVAVTNTSVSGNSFLIQLPTVGTNTAAGAWWYTVYFEKNGRKYWTGNGIVDIEETTSTADGLVWQEITSGGSAGVESDPIYTAWDKSTGISITESQISDFGTYLTVESDPIYTAWRDSGEPEQMIIDATNAIPPIVESDPIAYPVATNALAIAGAAVETELDVRALKNYHYGDPDIVVTPEAAFGFSAGEITSYDIDTYGTDVVIPYEIGGVAVTAIEGGAFADLDGGDTVTSVLVPKSVLAIGSYTFSGCDALPSVSLPSVTNIAENAFGYCTSLTSVYLGGNAPTMGANVFLSSTPTIYATDPQSTGWGATLGGRPVVRAPLYADAVYVDGIGVVARIAAAVADKATTNALNAAVADKATTNALNAAITAADALPYAITSASGTATVSRANGWLQSLDMTGPLVLNIGDGSASLVSQINLSVNAGTNALTYSVNATNICSGLSDITDTNTTTYLLYSPMFETTWEASEL